MQPSWCRVTMLDQERRRLEPRQMWAPVASLLHCRPRGSRGTSSSFLEIDTTIGDLLPRLMASQRPAPRLGPAWLEATPPGRLLAQPGDVNQAPKHPLTTADTTARQGA